jgi:hypothetical protein
MKPTTLLIVGFCFANFAILGQGVLIDQTTRNGSFEDGALAPWVSQGASVFQDASFASHGSWYGVVGSPNWAVGQFLGIGSTNGQSFLLSFDARGSTGTGFRLVQLSTRTETGPLTAIMTPISAPPLSSTEWRNYIYEFQFSTGDWTTPVGLTILFSGNGFGYVDDVLLLQVPEPSCLALLALAGYLIVAIRRLQA